MSDSPGELSPPPASRSATLAELYAEDRREHADVPPVGSPEYHALRERDRRRRVRAADLLDSLEASGAASAEDLYHAAWLLNHGDEPAEARRAHELAREAAERGHRPARWLAAAAYDRWCMHERRPPGQLARWRRARIAAIERSTTKTPARNNPVMMRWPKND